MDVLEHHPTQDPGAYRLDDLLALLQVAGPDTHDRAAVLLGDDHILRHVHQTPCQVSCIRRLQCCVRQTFASSVRRYEVLENAQAFAEVRHDRILDNLTDLPGDLLLRFRHQSSHAGELAFLLFRSPGSGVGHHVDRVKAVPVLAHPVEHRLGDV